MASITVNMHIELGNILKKVFQPKVEITHKILHIYEWKITILPLKKLMFQQSYNDNLRVSITCPNAHNDNKKIGHSFTSALIMNK